MRSTGTLLLAFRSVPDVYPTLYPLAMSQRCHMHNYKHWSDSLLCSDRFGTWTLANVSVPSLLTRDPSGPSGATRMCWSAHLRTIRCVTTDCTHAHTQVATRTYTHGRQWPSHLQAILWSIRHCRYQRQLLGHKGAVFAADLDSRAALCCTASGDKVRAY